MRLSESTLDCDALRLEAIGELRRVVGFDRWCWPLADPETLITNSGLAEHDYVPGLPRALELEYTIDDFAAKRVLARRTNAAGSLSAETRGDLARSPRWDEVMRPVGIGDVAAVACRDRHGTWGWIEAYRDRGDPPFDDDDVALLGAVGASLGAALRRTTYAGASSPAPNRSPGTIVLDHDVRPVGWTVAARAWIDAMPGARFLAQLGMLPSVIYPIAVLARNPATAAGAHSMVRTVDGRWAMVEAARLEGEDERRVAVTLRSPTATEMFDLLSRAYAFTSRERQLVAALATGLDTRTAAEQLLISPHTIQDHLKAVFQKAGVHSRRELLAVFRGSDVTPASTAGAE